MEGFIKSIANGDFHVLYPFISPHGAFGVQPLQADQINAFPTYEEALFIILARRGPIKKFPGVNSAKSSSTFFQGAKYSPKVLRQMSKSDDLFHGFPKSVDGYATKFGQWTTKVGADGKTYQWLKMQGSYRGKTGTFEFIKDANGVINHRFFNVP